jgi:hypothetical protein
MGGLLDVIIRAFSSLVLWFARLQRRLFEPHRALLSQLNDVQLNQLRPRGPSASGLAADGQALLAEDFTMGQAGARLGSSSGKMNVLLGSCCGDMDAQSEPRGRLPDPLRPLRPAVNITLSSVFGEPGHHAAAWQLAFDLQSDLGPAPRFALRCPVWPSTPSG